jgi:hypothetical protein
MFTGKELLMLIVDEQTNMLYQYNSNKPLNLADSESELGIILCTPTVKLPASMKMPVFLVTLDNCI